MSIPRWIGSGSAGNKLTIHVFANASRRAMAAVAYSRAEDESGKSIVRLLLAKTKLSPIRSLLPPLSRTPQMTIPRLELQAALTAARLLRSISDKLDYAGPFAPIKGRGDRTEKAWVAVFVCLTSKAVHLELVGDLTTRSVLGSLTRFTGRRGPIMEIWSDNATNFHRASLELLRELQRVNLILNSRPLGPIVGEPVIAIPEANLDSELNVDLLHHWKLVQALRAVFWNRRGKEYLNTLQQRVKWRCRHENLSVGDCVVIVDPSFMTATGRWPLGRVTKVYLGQDGMVRVADVRTAPNDAPASTA
ncbi:hypothetical protein TKK_0017839 [Trichogramma kaykai]